MKELSADGIKTNVTLNFSLPIQALLAAKCGATYISPFVGRLDAIGHNGMDLRPARPARFTRQLRIQDPDSYGRRAPSGALRAGILALAGADACTMFFDFAMKMLYDHPLTDSGLDTFLERLGPR